MVRRRDDRRVQGTLRVNRWSLVATQDPIKKDGRADLFLDPPCRANVLRRDRQSICIHKLESSVFLFNVMRLFYSVTVVIMQESLEDRLR